MFVSCLLPAASCVSYQTEPWVCLLTTTTTQQTNASALGDNQLQVHSRTRGCSAMRCGPMLKMDSQDVNAGLLTVPCVTHNFNMQLVFFIQRL